MAAGMHLAVDLGSVCEAVFFMDIESIEVGPQADGTVRATGFQATDQARLAISAHHVDPERCEFLRYEISGFDLLKRGFWAPMQLPPPGLHVWLGCRYLWHQWSGHGTHPKICWWAC